MRYLLLLLIIIPAAEMGLLLFSGKTIGIVPTILLIIGTGVLGTYLAKREGLETIKKAQEQLRYGSMPGDAILDGLCIIIGGVLLLTPGFITDLTGLFFLLPPTRIFFKRMLFMLLKKWINNGNITIIR